MRRPPMGSGPEAYQAWIDSTGKLSEEQERRARALIDASFPFRESVDRRKEVVDALLWRLADFLRARNAGVGDFYKRPARLEAAAQIRELVADCSSDAEFRDRRFELGPLARWIVLPRDRDRGNSFAIRMAVKYGDPHLRSVYSARSVPRGADYVRLEALEWADHLERPLPKGRRIDSPARSLAAGVFSLWVQFTDVSVHPNKRDALAGPEGLCPCREFLGEFARIVDPEFNPSGAYRAVYKLWKDGELNIERLFLYFDLNG